GIRDRNVTGVQTCALPIYVWRFPMLVSKYGGMTFLIWYFIFAFIICQSGMMEEFSLGRWAHSGPSGAFAKAMENGGKSKKVGQRSEERRVGKERRDGRGGE